MARFAAAAAVQAQADAAALEDGAALAMQTGVRGYMARKVKKERELQLLLQDRAAGVLQRAARVKSARSLVRRREAAREHERLRVRCAVRFQCLARRVRARKELVARSTKAGMESVALLTTTRQMGGGREMQVFAYRSGHQLKFLVHDVESLDEHVVLVHQRQWEQLGSGGVAFGRLLDMAPEERLKLVNAVLGTIHLMGGTVSSTLLMPEHQRI
jgi:hypothetical protein